MKTKMILGLGLSLLPVLAFSQSYQHQDSQMMQHQTQRRDVTPTVGPLPGHHYDIVLDAEFLWWTANVTNLDYAQQLTLSSEGDTTNPTATQLLPNRTYEMDWNWDPGVRLGIGIVTNHDGWDLYFDWTYTYISTHSSQSVPPFFADDFDNAVNNPIGTKVLADPWSLDQDIDEFLFTHIGAKWSILFHQFDLELGRNYWISKTLTLRPYLGLRGHWSRMHFNTHKRYDNQSTSTQDPLVAHGFDHFKQNLWTVGLLAGIDTAWHISKHWCIFTQGDVSLTYGKFTVRRQGEQVAIDQQERQILDIVYTIRHDNIYTMLSTFDLALGLRFETTLYNDAFRLLFDLGWENHFWPDFNKLDRNTTDDADLYVSDSANGNLMMTGIVFRSRFEF